MHRSAETMTTAIGKTGIATRVETMTGTAMAGMEVATENEAIVTAAAAVNTAIAMAIVTAIVEL